MTYDQPESIEPDDDWGRRRDNMRHDVSAQAVVTDRHGIVIPCRIEDVSASGMALGMEPFTPEPGREPLAQGTVARVAFDADRRDPPDARIEVDVRVMWRTPSAAGVRFLDHPPGLREALRAMAGAAVAARIDETERSRRELGPEQRRVMQACRRTVHKLLPNILWIMRIELLKRLRMNAGGDGSDEPGQARQDAERLEDKAMAIGRTAEHQILRGFSEAGDLDQTQELTMMQVQASLRGDEAGGGPLGVVQDRALEHSARVTAIAHAVEERYKSEFFELDVRLANVIGHPLDQNVNTVAPGSLCRVLWDAVIRYCDSPCVQRHLQQVMLHEVMPLIGELYQAVNDTLDAEGAARIFDVRRAAAPRRED